MSALASNVSNLFESLASDIEKAGRKKMAVGYLIAAPLRTGAALLNGPVASLLENVRILRQNQAEAIIISLLNSNFDPTLELLVYDLLSHAGMFSRIRELQHLSGQIDELNTAIENFQIPVDAHSDLFAEYAYFGISFFQQLQDTLNAAQDRWDQLGIHAGTVDAVLAYLEDRHQWFLTNHPTEIGMTTQPIFTGFETVINPDVPGGIENGRCIYVVYMHTNYGFRRYSIDFCNGIDCPRNPSAAPPCPAGNPVCDCPALPILPAPSPSPLTNQSILQRHRDRLFALRIREANHTVRVVAPTVISPLVINLEGTGIHTLPVTHGVRFDHEATGYRTATGWVAPTTALLVHPNADGQVLTGRELFGNNTLLRAPTAANGFIALRQLSITDDGLFDTRSPYWHQLYLWFDVDSSGVARPEHLIPLRQSGIQSINLNYVNSDFVDPYGNEFKQKSTATMVDGRVVDIVDVWFLVDHSDREPRETITISPEVAALPQIRGVNRLPSLHQAMMANPQLRILVEQFLAEPTHAIRQQLARQIVFTWTGTTTVIPALDVLTGQLYTGQTGPNVMALLNRTFDGIVDTVYTLLATQSHLYHLYSLISIQPAGNHTYTYDLLPVANHLVQLAESQMYLAAPLLYDFINSAMDLEISDASNFPQFIQYIRTYRNNLAHTVEGMGNANTRFIFGAGTADVISVPNVSRAHIVHAFNGNNTINVLGGTNNRIYSGTGNDTINITRGSSHVQIEGGNNTIRITAGNNTINPGPGTNRIYGGSDSDIYVIGRNFTNNTITANSAPTSVIRDRLIFTDDVHPDEVFLVRRGNNLDVVVAINGNYQTSPNRTTLIDFFCLNQRRVADATFPCGTVIPLGTVRSATFADGQSIPISQ